jgi:hypothetical protein
MFMVACSGVKSEEKNKNKKYIEIAATATEVNGSLYPI